MAKRNPIARLLADAKFRKRIVKSAKQYRRLKKVERWLDRD